MSFNLLSEVVEEPVLAQKEEEELFTVDTDKRTDVPASGEAPAVQEAAEEGEAEHITDKTNDTAQASGDSDSEAGDAEDWADISKGRYFGDPNETADAMRCHNCKSTGHKRKDCPHSLCRTCGALDDHDTVRCPLTQRCFNCARLGHLASACPEPPRQSGSHCKECGSRSHLARSCPQIWRLYHPDSNFDPETADWSGVAYCYNCADQGHYGDDCDLPHRVRLIEPSAFCEANEPETRRPRKRIERPRHAQRAPPEAPGAPSNHDHGRRGHAHYEPYRRPELISERYPRGVPGYGHGGRDRDRDRDRDNRRPVPAAQRMRDQQYAREQVDHYREREQPQKGGKPYRGGMFRGKRRR